ncbi:MAG: RNA methyltransferase, partial [Fusobacteriaceae bacterium]
MREGIYLALVHYPVYNKNHDVVCTSVTNYDIHDISRSCRTYDVNQYHIIVPVEAQK